MGSENSKMTQHKTTATRNITDSGDTEVHQALQQQKEKYEKTYTDLIQSQIMIHQSINKNLNRSPPCSNPLDLSIPSTSSQILTPHDNIKYPGVLNTGARPKLRSSTQVSSAPFTSSHRSTPSGVTPHCRRSPTSPSAIVSAPSSSSHILTPSNNSNCGNISNTGARPKNSIVKSSTSSTAIVAVPSTSSDILTPSPNVNDGIISKTEARPKSRITPEALKNNSLVTVRCVTCQDDFKLQIYQCQNGHSSCNWCKFLNKKCGNCFKPITDVRNITLETTIADIIVKQSNTDKRIRCSNANDGCCLSFTIKEMDTHLQECPYSDMECPLTSIFHTCTWKGKINNICDHFNNVHPDNCGAGVDQEMVLKNIKEDQTIVHYVKMGYFNFLIYVEVSKIKKTISMTAQLLGTKCSASKWTYEFVIYNKNTPTRKFQYFDRCYSSTASIQVAFDNAQCAAINTNYAKTFINRGCLNYKFFLKQNAKKKYNGKKNI